MLKNSAARLDPWEIFLLLALKIPFHFISLRKLENYLQFYMTIVFKLNRTKKSQHKFKFAFNLKKPQASRHALGYGGVPSFNLNNIKTNPRKKNPFNFTLFKNYSEQKKNQKNIEIAFKYIWKIYNKLIGPRKKKYRRIPFKFDLSSVYRLILCIFFLLFDIFYKKWS